VDWNTVPMPALNPARPALWPVCQRGDRHPVVKKLQQLLGLSADGIFGPATEGNVRRFQASRRIKADGQVGAGTWTALLAKLPADPLISPAKLSAAAAP
jgi:peptidoglycan hydrolase-like protein with peptidoglycan-binding domain